MAQLAINGAAPVRTKPFPVWPTWGDEEINNLVEVVKSGNWGCLKGKKTAEFERSFASYQQAKHGILMNSGTTALRIAAMAADIMAGSEVIVPAYTFIASASAVVEAGAVPVFVDIDPDTMNIDVQAIETAITERTSAIMPVHFAGRPAPMDVILSVARKHNLKVIEDAAQAWGSEWQGKRVGAIGDAGCFSFQSSKNINAGEGGIIVTNDDVIAKFARSHSNCGRSEDGLWYEHFYFGGNYRITEFQSVVLLAQFNRYEPQMRHRQQNLNYLNKELAKIQGIKVLSNDPSITSHSSHLYIFRYIKENFASKSKTAFIEALRKEGIPASPGYSLPLYKQPVFLNQAFGPRGRKIEFPVDYKKCFCPATEKAVFDEAIWLTQNILLGSRSDMDDIVAAVKKIHAHAGEMKDM